LLSRWRANPEGGAGEWAALAGDAMPGTALAGIVLATAFWLAGLAWTWAAWGALRVALGGRWWQSFLAAGAALALLGGLLRAVGWAASA
jgi:hypothetical protein